MNQSVKPTYEFGSFRLETGKRLLLRDGEVVPLRPKTFETLLTLVELGGTVVSKEELMQRIWPDSFVEEGNLSLNIHSLRRALGEKPDEHSFIVTVPGRGYSFVAEVREVVEANAEIVIAEPINEGVIDGEKTAAGKVVMTSPSASNLVAAPRRRTQGLVFVLGFVVAATGLAFGLYEWFARRQPESPEPFQNIKLERLTTTGRAREATISPDGKYVVYVSDDAGKQSLRLRQLATGSDTQILPPADTPLLSATFSPDGSYVYYVAEEGNRAGNVLCRVPLPGGTVKKLMANVNWPVAFAPDGQRFAFARNNPSTGESALIVADTNGSNEMVIMARKLPDFFRLPAWSPDGHMIACAVYMSDAGGRSWHVIAVPVAGGKEKRITRQGWQRVEQMAWLADGSGLILPAVEMGAGLFQVWRLAYPSGEVRRITNDLSSYRGMSLTRDSRVMVTVQSETTSSIWVAPQNDAGRARRVTSGKYDGIGGLAWTPEGQIVYETKNADGSSDLGMIDPNGGQPKRLTENAGVNRWPTVSPDGRFIVFESNRSGAFNIWRINQDGSSPKQLTRGRNEVSPDCTPDGNWVVYHSLDSGKMTLWKVPIDGGTRLKLSDRTSTDPVISPDGRLIACLYADDHTALPSHLAVMQFEGQSSEKVFDVSPTSGLRSPIRWTSNGYALAYIDTRNEVSNIWSQPLAGGQPRQITDFKSEHIFFFGWSRDGQQFACARGGETSDVVVISQR